MWEWHYSKKTDSKIQTISNSLDVSDVDHGEKSKPERILAKQSFRI